VLDRESVVRRCEDRVMVDRHRRAARRVVLTAALIGAGAGAIVAPRASSTVDAPGAHVACGTERWAVKTLSDPDAGLVNLTPKSTTIAYLRTLAAPSSLPARRLPPEFQAYRVAARLLAFRFERDGDVHLEVADPGTGGTMIVEFPNSGCTRGASVSARHRIAQAKLALVTACGTPGDARFTTLHGTATITGVLFFDFKHGQRGVAPSAVELHPVTSFSSSSCRTG
jgi:hypothetical protein